MGWEGSLLAISTSAVAMLLLHAAWLRHWKLQRVRYIVTREYLPTLQYSALVLIGLSPDSRRSSPTCGDLDVSSYVSESDSLSDGGSVWTMHYDLAQLAVRVDMSIRIRVQAVARSSCARAVTTRMLRGMPGDNAYQKNFDALRCAEQRVRA